MRFQQITFILTGLLTGLSGYAAAASPAEPFEAEYVLYSRGFEVAHVTRMLEQAPDGTYTLSSDSKTVGMASLFRDDRIHERSHWQLTESGMQPLNYVYDHRGSKRNRQVNIDFDWDAERVRMDINDDHWHMDLEPGTLDKLLYQLALMHDLQLNGEQQTRYRVADGGSIRDYDFEPLGNERVETPMGEFDTVKMARYRDDSDRETILWCAEALGYLPVKVVHIEPDGLQTTTLLKSYRKLPSDTSTPAVEDR